MKLKFNHLIKTYPVTFVAIAALVAVSVITAFFNWQIAIGELAVAIVISVVAIFKTNNDFKIVKNAVITLNASLSPEENGGLINFSLPVVIYDLSDKIKWYNNRFKDDIIGSKAQKLDEISVFTGGKNQQQMTELNKFSVRLQNKDYTIIKNSIKFNGKTCFALFYIDDTALKAAVREYKMSKPAVALIVIDSIDEFYRVYKESEYAEIIGAVERLTENWFSQFSGIFRKLGTGRFLSVMSEEDLQKMLDVKFDILEKVRTYTYNGTSVGITLSAGIGRGESLSDAEQTARQALDMALGRGGDQVAVKDNEKYTFFGGVSGGVEKRTKVRTRVVASAIAELISNSSNVIIMGHKFSDLDSVGAAVGIYKASKALSREAKIVINRKTSLSEELIKYLEGCGEDCFVSPMVCEHLMGSDTLLVIVDTHKANFVDSQNIYDKAQNVIIIDHHRKTVDHITNATIFYHEPHASSTCEMVTELLQYIGKKPVVDSVCANALLAGIMLDTKDFVLRTGVRTFEAAAYLRSRGADTVAVKKFFANTMESRKLRGHIVMTAETYKKCAVSIADIKSDEIRIISAQAADELLSVSNVDASFVIFKTGDITNISARSMGSVNVQLIMEYLGGGGHQTMAAAQLADTDIIKAKNQLKQAIDQYFENI